LFIFYIISNHIIIVLENNLNHLILIVNNF
jgi:hypothetical protein